MEQPKFARNAIICPTFQFENLVKVVWKGYVVKESNWGIRRQISRCVFALPDRDNRPESIPPPSTRI